MRPTPANILHVISDRRWYHPADVAMENNMPVGAVRAGLNRLHKAMMVDKKRSVADRRMVLYRSRQMSLTLKPGRKKRRRKN